MTKEKIMRITIIHNDITEKEKDKSYSLSDNRKISFKVDPETEYLNTEKYQNKRFYDSSINLTEFLDTQIWIYDKIIITHKYQGED